MTHIMKDQKAKPQTVTPPHCLTLRPEVIANPRYERNALLLFWKANVAREWLQKQITTRRPEQLAS